jgi:hypothetical protein
VGYRFLIVKSGVPDVHVGTIMESRHTTFFEDIFPMKKVDSTSSHELSINNEPKEPAVLIEHNEQILRRMAMKLLERARDRGLQSPLVMISLCTSWMTLLEPLKGHIPLRMLAIGRKQFGVRWTLLCLMVLGRLWSVPMCANL